MCFLPLLLLLPLHPLPLQPCLMLTPSLQVMLRALGLC
jgi:hypothetical protein